MNVHVLDINGGGEGFECIVVEAVQRGHQAQVFRDALRDVLGERVILHRQGDVTAEQFQGIKFTVFVKRISGAPPETDNASQPALSGARHLKSSGATLPFELKKTEYVEGLRTTGPRPAVKAWTCLGRRGMKAGSGMSANPNAVEEVSTAGLSL